MKVQWQVIDSLRRFYFDICLYTQEALELSLKVVGPDRCLFGTDPGTGSVSCATGRPLDDLKPVIESIEFLTTADRQNIFKNNTERLFGRFQSGSGAKAKMQVRA